MIEHQFTELLQNYPDALSDRRRFAGLLKDLMPGMALQTNLFLNLYDINIHEELEKAALIDNVFSYRFAKRLCDEYGVSKRNADWAVATWCACYGEIVLGKTIEVEAEPETVSPSNINELKTETLTTIFDITANEYVVDWRNVYEYEIIDGGVIIKKYIAFDAEIITAPDTIDGFPVVEIGEKAFENCKTMKSIRLPDTIRKLGDWAFSNCTFKQITLPSDLIEMGSFSFYSCAITSIVIPPNVKIIGAYSFSGCKQLRKVSLVKNLKSIGNCAFEGCTELMFIDIPEGVEEIRKNAFKDCYGLKKIRIPNSVIKIGDQGKFVVLESVFAGFRANHVKGKVEFVTENITIYCNIGSEALKYARKQNIKMDKYENYSED